MPIFEDITEKAMRAVSDTTGLALTIIGAGASGSLAGIVKSWFPEQTSTIADETLATAVGFALFMWGDKVHPLLSSFGFGVLISSVGAWTSSFTVGMLSALQKK